MPDLAFGITAGARPWLSELGPALEALGYDELWANDTRSGDGLATLRDAAGDTASLRLAVGVVALSEETPMRIAERIGGAGLPLDRLTLGVGSGSSTSLALVRDGVAELRNLLPGVAIGVAAIGPRMAHLAGEVADVVLANWVLPARLAWIHERVSAGAVAAGRPVPRMAAYVRTAVGMEADARIRAEMDRYRRAGRHYARAFDAQGDELIGLAGHGAEGLRDGLAAYRSVADTTVIRGLPEDESLEGWLAVARAARDAAQRRQG